MGVHATADDACEKEVFYVGLHGLCVVEGLEAAVIRELDACHAEEVEAGLIAGERDDIVVGDGQGAIGGNNVDFAGADGG